MNAGIVPFNYREMTVRVVMVDGEPWFALSDLCAVLEIANTRNVAARLADDQKGVRSMDTPGGRQQMTVVNESGMYEVVIRSDKPEAVSFRRWITGEVLPQIRKTGGYGAQPALPDITTPAGIAFMAEMFHDTAQKLVLVTNEKKCLEAAIERDAPLVAKAEAHSGSDSAIHRQEFAREVIAWGLKQNLTIREKQVFQFLGHIGLFIRGDRTDTGHATADALKRGLAFTDKGTAKNGYAWATGKLTAAGQDYAWKRITKYVDANGTLELPRELRGGESA